MCAILLLNIVYRNYSEHFSLFLFTKRALYRNMIVTYGIHHRDTYGIISKYSNIYINERTNDAHYVM